MAALQEVIGELATDPSARAALEEDPQGFLAAHGLDGFSAEDLRDALDLAADGLPVHVAAHLTGTDLPAPVAGEGEDEAVLRLLGHVADTPDAPVEDLDVDAFGDDQQEEGDDVPDLDFGSGHVGDEPAPGEDASVDADGDPAAEADEVEAELDGGDGAAFDAETPAELIPQLEEEEPDLGEPEALGEESEEAPGHWGDHHTDDGGLDPEDFGHDLGDLPHA